MASFESRKDKFGFNKLRRMFIGGSINTSDQLNRPGSVDVEYSPHTSFGNKQSVCKSHIYSHMPTGQDEGFTRNNQLLAFSSSVPVRGDIRPALHKKNSMHTTPRHPTLAFSKSLPGYDYNEHDNFVVNESKATQTGGKQSLMKQSKLKLSRTGEETFFRPDDKLRRKAEIWRNDLAAVKKRKQDVDFNFKRNFCFDDQISLTSEDHIYEEINSDLFTSCGDEENTVEENFLLGISLERRNNLKFYGCTGWDFGNGN